jgi:hypothetical protein
MEISSENKFIKLHNLFVELAWKFFGNNEAEKIESGDTVDICRLIRRVFLIGPLMIAIYLAFYYMIFHAFIGGFFMYGPWAVMQGWTIMLVGAVTVGLVVVSVVYGPRVIMKTLTLKSSNDPSVIKTWYESFKTKTCIIFKVR